MNKELWFNEAMLQFDKKFFKGVLNIVNAPAGSGKTQFIFNEFLTESYKYVDKLKKTDKQYIMKLNRILYICDTNMLKTSVLVDTLDKDVTKVLSKGDLKEAMETKKINTILQTKIGHIKVITYSTFGWLLQQEGSKYILLNYFDVFLMDEMHNLFKYASRFDSELNNKPYSTVISYLPTLIYNSLVIGLSATIGLIYNGIRDMELPYHSIFTYQELKQIKQYTEKYIRECKYIINEIKWLGIVKNFLYKNNYKAYIYTNTIKMSKKYKKMLEDYGYKVEWLCSINNTTVNEDGEIIPIMNDYQLSIRNDLINTGMLPSDLDIIIVNSGYETGWNLRDEKVQVALIDSKDDGTQIQARNRIRHNILELVHTAIMDEDGEVYEYGQFRQLERKNYKLLDSYLKIKLDDKYLNRKLSKEDKDFLVYKYAIIQNDKVKANWKTFKKDLLINNYTMDINNSGTYIYKTEDYEKIKLEQTNNQKSKKDGVVNMKINSQEVLKDYMDVKLFKDKQEEIQNKLMDIKVKTNGNGTLGKKMVQSIVEDCGYIFISRQETKGALRKKTYWYITNIIIK